MDFHTLLLRLAVLGFCGWQAMDLRSAWGWAAPEHPGVYGFAIWLGPALMSAVPGWGRGAGPRPNGGGRWLEPGRGRERSGRGRERSGGAGVRWECPGFLATGPVENWSSGLLLAAALVLSTVGQLSSVNAIQHLGLAAAVAGCVPARGWRGPWLAAAVLWVPACGWCCHSLLGTACSGGRLFVLGLVSLGCLVSTSRVPILRPLRAAAPLLVLGAIVFPHAECRADTFTYSPVQSPARPFGLEVVDLVGLAGSDAASAEFQQDVLPGFLELVNRNLGESQAIRGSDELVYLDPSKLTLQFAADVRAYFVGEGAGYHNSFGFNTQGGGIDSGDPLLIFPDASSPSSFLSSGGRQRTTSEPLMPGDFVELGSFQAGTHLDFFLIADGARGGKHVFSTDASLNRDGISHVVAFPEVASPYLLIGFEDLFGGGDQDYNDLLVALYIGEQNVSYLVENARLGDGVPAPEPGSLAALLLGLAGWLYYRRRRKFLPSFPTGSGAGQAG